MTTEIWWHVIWTTFSAWSPTDARGQWNRLSEAYAPFERVPMSHRIDRRWQGQPIPEDAVRLSPRAREVVARGIVELAESDRIAGETSVSAVSVGETTVQIVLACPAEALQQRVGRLKSRTSTLLSFDPLCGAGGKGTWGGGFWWARLDDDAVRRTAETFVREDACTSSGLSRRTP